MNQGKQSHFQTKAAAAAERMKPMKPYMFEGIDMLEFNREIDRIWELERRRWAARRIWLNWLKAIAVSAIFIATLGAAIALGAAIGLITSSAPDVAESIPLTVATERTDR